MIVHETAHATQLYRCVVHPCSVCWYSVADIQHIAMCWMLKRTGRGDKRNLVIPLEGSVDRSTLSQRVATVPSCAGHLAVRSQGRGGVPRRLCAVL